MLRRRPPRTVRRVLSHPAAGWLALSALYLTAAVLNLLLAARTEAFWPLALAAALAIAALACATAAARGPRR